MNSKTNNPYSNYSYRYKVQENEVRLHSPLRCTDVHLITGLFRTSSGSCPSVSKMTLCALMCVGTIYLRMHSKKETRKKLILKKQRLPQTSLLRGLTPLVFCSTWGHTVKWWLLRCWEANCKCECPIQHEDANSISADTFSCIDSFKSLFDVSFCHQNDPQRPIKEQIYIYLTFWMSV